MLDRSIQDGCLQYVVLGAGLDSWALRHHDSGVAVFELDHPATQQWKKARIEFRKGSLPPKLALIPIDFERESLTNLLPGHGFDPESKGFVSWLGTIYYLTRGAIKDTFVSLAEICAENALDLKGYIRVSGREKAQILIRFAYGIGNPQTITYTTTTAPGYAYSIGWWWQIVPPTVETSKTTTYHRHLILEAFYLKTPGRLPQLWKTTVQSDGASSDIRIALPYLITAASDYLGTNTGSKLSAHISMFDPRIDDIKLGSRGVTKTEGPIFGISGWGVPDSIAPYVGRRKKGAGVVVDRIFPNTLARKMGLQKGDIILEVNGKDVKEPGDIRREIQSLKSGGKVTIQYWRSGPGEVVKTDYLE